MKVLIERLNNQKIEDYREKFQEIFSKKGV